MPHRKQIAVILAGSGVYDGSEIHEAVFALWAIEKAGAVYRAFAPDIDQYHVINHLSGEPVTGKRNVLMEAARITRGKIAPLSLLDPGVFDAVIIPGGYGVAKNLCSFAFDGANCKVDEQVAKIIKGFHKQRKPIGALCISPVLVAKVLGKVDVTIGSDKDTANALTEMGARHTAATHGEVVVDKENNVYTTPCYMLDASITQIASDVEKLVNVLVRSLE
ncbi:MAG: isoprenoid biosynthesis glyoxalase ElbB [Breznakibacter sp.]